MVRDFQKIIGEEARAQVLDLTGRLPDAVVACVGGGTNAIGIFHAFLDDADVELYGFEAAGDGVDHRAARGDHRARTTRRAARRAQLRAAGRGRPDDRVALDLGRPRLPGRRPRARVAQRHRPRPVHPRDRRRGDGGAAPAQPHRGHHPRDRVGARPGRRAEARRELGAGRDDPRQPLRPRRQGHGDRRQRTSTSCDAPRTRSEVDELASSPRIAPPTPTARGALVGYLPVGFPDLATSIDAAVALAENGVDVLELGLPYSDPVMDGTVIQEATQTALADGFRLAPRLHGRRGDHGARRRRPCSS